MPLKIKYVNISNGRWVYRPRKTKEFADCIFPLDSRGFLKPPIKLGMKGDSEDKITKAYVAAKNTLLANGSYSKGQLGYICEKYLSSERYKEKAPRTQSDGIKLSRIILRHKLKIDGIPASLADMQLEDLTKPLMNEIRSKRLEIARSKGHDGCVNINRQVGFLSTAIGWGLNNISGLPQIANPLKGIEKFKEKSNTRYVTDKEFQIQCKEAEKIVDYLPLLIRLSYLIGSRGAETAMLRYSDCVEKGLDVTRLKGSKDNIIAWSPALNSVISKAKELNKTRKKIDLDSPIITNTAGGALTPSGIQSTMSKLKKHMKKQGLEEVYFSLHKTKSKAQSDSKDDNISGLTSQMKDLYNTKKHVINTGLK